VPPVNGSKQKTSSTVTEQHGHEGEQKERAGCAPRLNQPICVPHTNIWPICAGADKRTMHRVRTVPESHEVNDGRQSDLGGKDVRIRQEVRNEELRSK
jgi:hypothetical protein